MIYDSISFYIKSYIHTRLFIRNCLILHNRTVNWRVLKLDFPIVQIVLNLLKERKLMVRYLYNYIIITEHIIIYSDTYPFYYYHFRQNDPRSAHIIYILFTLLFFIYLSI